MKRLAIIALCIVFAFSSCSKADTEIIEQDDIQVVESDENGEDNVESNKNYVFLGDDFQVNTYSNNNQNYPKIAMGADGKAIIVWESEGFDGDGHTVAAQKYNADGSKWGNEFIVNTETKSTQSQPTVAVANDGSHIIFWRSKDQDGSGFGVYAQRYNSSGNAIGDEFRINEETNTNQDQAYAAYHENGNLMVIWESAQDGKAGEIYARVYDKDFNDISNGEFRINTIINGWQNTARIAAVPNGFIVVWESLVDDFDSERLNIVFKRFDSEGNELSATEELVNTRKSCDQKNPDIATQADGTFVIVWEHLEDPEKCSSAGTMYSDITARMYDSNGAALTDEIILSQNTSGTQNLGITRDNRGGYVAIWQGDASSSDNTDEIYGRRLLKTGALIGNVSKVNSRTDSYQVFPAIAAAPDGSLLAVWGSWSGDGNGTSIRARLLKVGE